MRLPRANYGITRIDQPEKKSHGFYVRLHHRGQVHARYVADKASGGRSAALKRARAWRDEVIAALPGWQPVVERRDIPQSPVAGVLHVVVKAGTRSYAYWQAAWNGANGFRRTAKFSIARYGDERARQMAEETATTHLKPSTTHP